MAVLPVLPRPCEASNGSAASASTGKTTFPARRTQVWSGRRPKIECRQSPYLLMNLNNFLKNLGWKFDTGGFQPFAELRSNTGGPELSHYLPFARKAGTFKNENVLSCYQLAFHAQTLGDVCDLS